jgi:hypothetical protein
MSVINVTFVNFTTSDSQFKALEACGKCKTFQGGSTTFTRNITVRLKEPEVSGRLADKA